MSSLRVKKAIVTYSRQKKPSLYDQEPPLKRRRVETTTQHNSAERADTATPLPFLRSLTPTQELPKLPSSSPKQSAAIFSDEAPTSTPPSFPAPQSSSPPLRRRRPIFSSLKRRQKPALPAKGPLSESNDNVTIPPKQPALKKKPLVQMQLDLVAELNKTCKVCGMDYIPSHADDAALHQKFHALNVGGIDIPKALSERLRRNQVWSGGDRSFVTVVSRRDTPGLRNKASEVLKVVNTELGAVPITNEMLWSQVVQGKKTQHSTKENVEALGSDRFKMYLYIQGQKCVGACLAERIHEAFAVLDEDGMSAVDGHVSAEIPSSSITISNKSDPAILGISRIWTSNLHRNHGIARQLLDCARSDFLYGMVIDTAKVAFSQPTESGGQLARKWFVGSAGWHVYID